MRNTLSGGNTPPTILLSSRAEARSCPNGFSMTTRRQPLVGLGEAVLLELRHHDREESGRDREVERVVAVGALLLVELAHGVAQPFPGGVVVELARHEPDAGHELLPHGVAPRRAGAVLGGLLDERLELLVAEVVPGEADQGESGRQQAAVGEVVDGRDELLAGQVAGDTEQDQAARAGDARQTPILGIAQRVRDEAHPSSSSRRSGSAVDGSARCSLSTGRPCSRSTWASPAACEAMNSPNVKSRPGTGRSSTGSDVSCR